MNDAGCCQHIWYDMISRISKYGNGADIFLYIVVPGGMNIHKSQLFWGEFPRKFHGYWGKRGLPLYPLKEGSKQDPTVVISAGQHLQLQRWRRFQTNPVAWHGLTTWGHGAMGPWGHGAMGPIEFDLPWKNTVNYQRAPTKSAKKSSVCRPTSTVGQMLGWEFAIQFLAVHLQHKRMWCVKDPHIEPHSYRSPVRSSVCRSTWRSS